MLRNSRGVGFCEGIGSWTVKGRPAGCYTPEPMGLVRQDLFVSIEGLQDEEAAEGDQQELRLQIGKDSDRMSVTTIAKDLQDLAQRGREPGRDDLGDMSGGFVIGRGFCLGHARGRSGYLCMPLGIC